MVGVFLLIHVDEARYCASVRLSASRGVNTLMFGVVPEVVDTGDTLKLSNLLARLRVQNNQQRRGASAIEKAGMGLIPGDLATPLRLCPWAGRQYLSPSAMHYAKNCRSG